MGAGYSCFQPNKRWGTKRVPHSCGHVCASISTSTLQSAGDPAEEYGDVAHSVVRGLASLKSNPTPSTQCTLAQTLEIAPLTSKIAGRWSFVMPNKSAFGVSKFSMPKTGNRFLKFILEEILSLGITMCTNL